VGGGTLPTEAEWEYSARGGSTEARYGPIDEVAWSNDNSGGGTHDVAQKRADGFGLYDMLGNVSQWVNDWYGLNYYQSSPTQDPQGPTNGDHFVMGGVDFGPKRVVRGGSWFYIPRVVRVSWRSRGNPTDETGFRCCGDAGIP
jgi:formylglycine-generating enzyme required for sulfatase activity